MKKLKAYQLEEQIGSGGVGIVYRAYQDIIDRHVAIKVIHSRYVNNPDFIRRFQIEAQTIAHLEHPHIIPLYDYWRDPQGAYLVMRWVQNGSLRDHLDKRGAWSLAGTARLVEQLAGALTLAHRHRVIHRDIKPENILLDEEQNAYLSDFGIAIDLRDQTLLEENISFGTPSYSAPEQFTKKVVNAQTDVYSIGILIFELLTGQIPYSGMNTIEVLKKQYHQPMPSVTKFVPDISPQVDTIVWRATHRDWQRRYKTVTELAQALQAIAMHSTPTQTQTTMTVSNHPADTIDLDSEGIATLNLASESLITLDLDSQPLNTLDLAIPETRNPYKGLQAFSETDSDDFFGRDAEIRALLARLETADPRCLALVGASGSGKSSLIHAGLFPALREGKLDGSESWFITAMVPGRNPLNGLREALRRVAIRDVANLDAVLADEPDGLTMAAQQLLPSDSTLLLHVDQFEEAFTLLEDEAARAHFLEIIQRAAAQDVIPIYIVLTLRADFYDRPLVYPAFADMLRQSTEVILPPSAEQLKATIVEPAERAGLQLERNLERVIIADVEERSNALPLLQYTLSELYTMREDNLLTVEAYESIGGVSGALAKRADVLYSTLPAEEKAVARAVFLRLVVLSEQAKPTRQRVFLSDVLGAFSEKKTEARSVLDVFARHRLFTYDRDPQTRLPTVEIAHEALLSAWEPLQQWIQNSLDTLRAHQRLKIAVADWQRAEEDKSFLASGARLLEFEQLRDDFYLNEKEARYLQESIQLRTQQRRRRRLTFATMATVAVMAVIFGVFALVQWQQAIQARNRANAEANRAKSRELATIARTNLARTDLAMLLSVEALNYADTFDARNSLLTALQWNPFLALYLHGHEAGVRSIAAHDNQFVTGAADGTLIWWNAKTGDKLREATQPGEINSVDIGENMVVSGGSDGLVYLWSADSGERIRTLPHEGAIWSLDLNEAANRLVVGDENGTLHRWDIKEDETLSVQTHEGIVFTTRLNTDGKRIVSGGDDGKVYLWDADTGDQLATMTGHNNWVLSATFHPTEDIIASSGADATVIVWNAETGDPLLEFPTEHDGWVRSIHFDPSGRFLVTTSLDSTARVWNWQTGELLLEPLTGHTDGIWDGGILTNPLRIVTAGVDGKVLLRDMTRPQPIISQHVSIEQDLLAVAVNPESELIAVGGGLQGNQATSGQIYLLDADTGETIRVMNEHRGPILDLDWHGGILASSSFDRTILLWDVETGQVEGTMSLPGTGAMHDIDFSADGERLYATTERSGVLVWDVDTRELHTQIPSSDPVESLAIQDNLLGVGYRNGSIALMNSETGEILNTFAGHDNVVTALEFSPDGDYLISTSRDRTVRMWDTNISNSDGTTFIGHQDWVLSLAVTDSYLATSGRDGQIILWDWHTRQPIGNPLSAHANWVTDVDFSKDHNQLLSVGAGGQVFYWEVNTNAWLRAARTIANRDLNMGEIDLYGASNVQPN